MSAIAESWSQAESASELAASTAVISLIPAMSALPRWAIMWLIAFTIFALAKFLSWMPASKLKAPAARVAAYFLAWPGLDALAFLKPAVAIPPPLASEWFFALAKTLLGIFLLGLGISLCNSAALLLSGWLGMIGILFTLHFGLFHLLSCFWRRQGVNAQPLMHWPILATSLSDFWGKRWNRAFRDLTHRFIFRPLTTRFGLAIGSLLAFAFSGLIHELAITVPAGGGYGGPTLYFLLQGVGVLFERSKLARRIGLGSPWPARLFAGAVIGLPVGLLFPRPFVVEVIVPFLQALGTLP